MKVYPGQSVSTDLQRHFTGLLGGLECGLWMFHPNIGLYCGIYSVLKENSTDFSKF